MINVRTARKVLDNLQDRRGTAQRLPRIAGQTTRQRQELALKRSKAQNHAQRGLIQLYPAEYRVLYIEALRRQGVGG